MYLSGNSTHAAYTFLFFGSFIQAFSAGLVPAKSMAARNGVKAKGAVGVPRLLNEYVGQSVQNFKFRGDIWGEQGRILVANILSEGPVLKDFVTIALMRIFTYPRDDFDRDSG